MTTPAAVGNILLDQQIHATGNEQRDHGRLLDRRQPASSCWRWSGADASRGRPDRDRLRRRADLDPGQAGQRPARRRRDLGGDASTKLTNVTVTATPTQKKDVYLERRRPAEHRRHRRLGRRRRQVRRARRSPLTAAGHGSIAFGVGQRLRQTPSPAPLGSARRCSPSGSTATGDTYWSQYTTSPGPAAGQPITINDTAPTNDRWNLAAVEVKAAPVSTGPPAVVDHHPDLGPDGLRAPSTSRRRPPPRDRPR